MRRVSSKVTEVVRLMSQLIIEADKKRFILVILLNSLLGISSGIALYLDKKVIDALGAGIQGASWAATSLVTFSIIRLVYSLIRDYVRRMANYFQNTLEMTVYNHINVTCARKHASVEVSIAEDAQFKNRYTKIERTTGNRAARLVGVVAEGPTNIIGLLSVLFVAFTLKPWVIIIPILCAIPNLFSAAKNIKERYAVETLVSPMHRLRNLAGFYLSDNVNLLELRLLRIKNHLVDKYRDIQNKIAHIRKAASLNSQYRAFGANIPGTIASVGISTYAGFQAIAHKITLGEAFTLTRAADQIASYINELFRNISDLYENHLYITDVNWLLSLPEKNETIGEPYPDTLATGLEFKDVWFKYPGSNKWILEGVNAKISPTENIAIVGENGAGKSTLVKLICGFYEPTKGEITLDGIPVRQYRRDQYWQKLATMFQDIETYGFSARESIGFGNIQKLDSQKDIQFAATFAHIHQWIESLPKQYDTPLIRDFEGGVTPSGGQKQRLALARTLLKDSQIVILDEPTASMDPAAEESIFNELLEWGKSKLLIFISHRFSTVRQADRIFVVENGKIAENGSHAELMKKKTGIYKKLFTMQAKNYQ